MGITYDDMCDLLKAHGEHFISWHFYSPGKVPSGQCFQARLHDRIVGAMEFIEGFLSTKKLFDYLGRLDIWQVK